MLGRTLEQAEPVAACEAYETSIRESASVGSRFNVGIGLVEWVAVKRVLGEEAMAVAGMLDLLDLLAVSGNRGQLSQAFARWAPSSPQPTTSRPRRSP